MTEVGEPIQSVDPAVVLAIVPMEELDVSNGPITSTTGNRRPAYTYDASKVTLRFIFANKDGLAVTMECTPNQTIGEIKGALMSVWPEGMLSKCTQIYSEQILTLQHNTLPYSTDLPKCSGGDRLRLVCMGKGMLMPDSRSLEDCQVPIFKTHPTPVNVSVKPDFSAEKQTKSDKTRHNAGGAVPVVSHATPQPTNGPASEGCCVIL